MENRPNPDNLLKHVQADEESEGRGRLKLFFGASPGVGKTYAMLEAARQRKKEGWDVVVGLVETHKRTETEALLDGLEILPRKTVTYKEVTLSEFDLDAALARHPRLIIVDELAHTNAPGLRHAKRWQDVEELLDAGIDVYTTLNVQHWETLNDVVAQITGVIVRETVPDTFLRRAHDLELVDLGPEDLITRLKEGKVYQGELAGRAAESFFKPGNLIALRELALRHTAERVDAQMQAFKERHAIAEVWPVGERLLVGVSPSPMSARLIRATSRLATRMRAPWIAVHVETPAFLRLSAEERDRTINHLRMAEKLGAETVTLTGHDVTEELIEFARRQNVTQIFLGKPADPRWKEWLFGSLVSKLARRCGDLDLHIISGVGPKLSDRRSDTIPSQPIWKRLGKIVAVIAAAVLLTSVVTVLRGQFLSTLVVMLAVGFFISLLIGRLRSQATALRERAERMRILYRLSRELSETPEIHQMLSLAQKTLEEFYKWPVLILLAETEGKLEVEAGVPATFDWTVNEQSVARWTFDHAQLAGAGSDTLSGAKGLYLPMKGLRSTVGVLGIRPENPKAMMEPERLQLLETFASEIGSAFESTRMSEEIGRNEVQMERQAIDQARAASDVRLSTLLSPDRILFLNEAMDRNQLIRTLLARLPIKNQKAALRAILKREKAGSTLIGPSVAIPHARLEGLNGIQVALALSKQGLVPISVLFVSPTVDAKAHLAFLSGLAVFFQKGENVAALAALKSPQEVLDYLRRSESDSAAVKAVHL